MIKGILSTGQRQFLIPIDVFYNVLFSPLILAQLIENYKCLFLIQLISNTSCGRIDICHCSILTILHLEIVMVLEETDSLINRPGLEFMYRS